MKGLKGNRCQSSSVMQSCSDALYPSLFGETGFGACRSRELSSGLMCCSVDLALGIGLCMSLVLGRIYLAYVVRIKDGPTSKNLSPYCFFFLVNGHDIAFQIPFPTGQAPIPRQKKHLDQHQNQNIKISIFSACVAANDYSQTMVCFSGPSFLSSANS